MSLWRARFAASTGEDELTGFYRDYRDSGSSAPRFAVTHPGRTAAAVVAVVRLPLLTVTLSGSVEGRAIRAVLSRRVLGLKCGTTGIAVLDVPSDLSDHLTGRRWQTLRRKVRAAERAGVRCSRVDLLSAREELLKLADAQERVHENPD